MTIDKIQVEVAAYFGIKLRDLTGPKRHKAIAHPRMVSMYLARKLTKLSYPEIGARYGGKDHSTVISAIRKIERLRVEDVVVRREVEDLEARLTGSQPAKKLRVFVQKWEESERGWGTRPDGYSIHPDEAALKRYIEAFWARQPKEAPDEYERPNGTPYWAEVEIEDDIGDGKRVYGHESKGYPGNGGPDGWKPVNNEGERK